MSIAAQANTSILPMISKIRFGPMTRAYSKLLFSTPANARKLERVAAGAYLRSLGVRGHSKIFTFTQPCELIALLRLAMCCPHGASALEIGSHLGASANFIAGGISKVGGQLYCIDTWNNETMPDGEQDTFDQFMRNTAALRRHITPLRGFSTKIDRSQIQGPVRLAFIDGDHSYEAVRADFEYYEPLFADNAVVAFHDSTSHEGVARFTGELLASGKWVIRGHVQSLLWMHRVEWQVGKRVINA